MKLFSTFSQFLLFLIIFTCQNVVAVPLTKWEAHKAMILNDHLRIVALQLQSQPFKSDISRKSAEKAIEELERLGQKDPSSSFAKDAQMWRDTIGKLASLSKGPVKEQLINPEEVEAAKNEVDKALEAIENPEPQKRFVIKEQKETMAINENKTIKSVEAELQLLAADKQRLLSRAEEIKEEYKKAVVEYRKKNQQALKKQLGFAIDVSKEVASFNARIDAIVKDILKKQRESKKSQPGGLSLEEKIDEFNDFVTDQIQLGQDRSYVDTKPLTQDEKDSIDIQLFTIIADIFMSLDKNNSEAINKTVDDIRQKAINIVDAQFEETAGFLGFFATTEDKDRKEKINKKLDEMVANLKESIQQQDAGQKELAGEEEVGVEQDEEEEIETPLTAPKRPPSSKPVAPVKKPSVVKKEEQKEVGQAIIQKQSSNRDVQDLSDAEQFAQMKANFTAWITKVFDATKQKADANDAVYGKDQHAYDDAAIKKADEMMKFLVEHPDLTTTLESLSDSIKSQYTQAIKNQIAVNSNFVYSSHESNEYNEVNRTKRFNDKLDEVFEKYTKQQQEIVKK